MPVLTPQSHDIVEWAEWFINRGWAVFPVCGPGMPPHKHGGVTCSPENRDYLKAPVGGSAGVKDATRDLATFKRLIVPWPGANLAGTPPENHFVLDQDEVTDFTPPASWLHTTGRENGKHFVYEQNPLNPVPQGQKPKQPFPGCDTRLPGQGYVVLPPSMHKSGVRYAIASTAAPVLWPSELKPFAHLQAKKTAGTRTKRTEAEPVLVALRRAPDDPDAGDSEAVAIAGYLARYVPSKEHYVALLDALNMRLADPLDGTAMGKKYALWDRHQASQQEELQRVLTEEERGWLLDRLDGSIGWDTPIMEKNGSITRMPISDFTMRATGVIVSPGFAKRVFIVDCTRGDDVVLKAQKLDTDVLCDTPRLRKWLAKRGLNMYDHHTKDPRRGAFGQRLIKILESQEPTELQSRDYYGWCEETEAFLIEQGEVTAEGLRNFTSVYPDDKLTTDCPTAFRFDASADQARSWLARVLDLMPDVESAKVGSWAMMLLLRGQWQGHMPGLLTQASAGSGKTTYYKLLFKLLGSTNEGERLTYATMRDKLLGNMSSAVWLDDVELADREQELMRGAITQGKITHKDRSTGEWVTYEKQLRASIVVSGEGVEWYRQKALRDRFIEVKMDSSKHETNGLDARKLSDAEDLGAGSGALLQLVLSEAHRLPELAALREGVRERDDSMRTTIRIGARVLDAVLQTGHKWTRLVDGWYLGVAQDDSKGHASEALLNVIPTLWSRSGMPKNPGLGEAVNPIWYDEVEKTFWVNAKRAADQWNQTQRNLNARDRQLASAASITRELDACGASVTTTKPTKMVNGMRNSPKFRQVPESYTRFAIDTLEHDVDYDLESEDQ